MRSDVPYRPLPEGVTIRESRIDGLGLFATEDLRAGWTVGLSHVFLEGEPDPERRVIRTPVGGHINHSDEPNCAKVESGQGAAIKTWTIMTHADIAAGEELTVRYTLYAPGEGDDDD
jgi:hypothetical protein